MKDLINNGILCLLITFSFGCAQNVTPSNPSTPSSVVEIGGDTAIDQVVELEGASSGGGGFADGYAMETLTLAKYALAQIIENTDESVFEDLPQGKRKEWIAKIIREISYIDDSKAVDNKYGRPAKFNYVDENGVEKIFVTKHFITTFPYGRFYTRPFKEKVRIIIEVYLDILHELSHFYGIGLTEESDYNSDAWAVNFIRLGIDKVYHCKPTSELEEDHVWQYKSVVVHPSTNLAKAYETEFEIEEFADEGSFLMPFITYDDDDLSYDFWEVVFASHLNEAKREFFDELGPFYQNVGKYSLGEGFTNLGFSSYRTNYGYSSNEILLKEDEETGKSYIDSVALNQIDYEIKDTYYDRTRYMHLGDLNKIDDKLIWSSQKTTQNPRVSLVSVNEEESYDFEYKYEQSSTFQINTVDMTAKFIKTKELLSNDLSAKEIMILNNKGDNLELEEITLSCESTDPKINIADYLGENFNKELFERLAE